MAPISFRQSASAVQLNDFSSGILDSSLNSFYTANNGANRSTFPYQHQGSISLRQMMEAWRWPSSYSQLSEYPDDADDPNWSDEGQGLATSENGQWVFTSNDSLTHPRIWRVPFTNDLDNTMTPDPDVNYAGLPASYHIGDYNHFGACDVYQNIAYVPVEYDVQENRVVRFSVTDSSINFLDGAYVNENRGSRTGASCVAINSRNEKMFVSGFDTFNNSLTHTMQIYSINGLTGLNESWPLLDNLPLYDMDGSAITLNRVQGSCISPAGHLYLVIDLKGESGGGFYGFDLITGRLVRYQRINYSSGTDGDEFELEDIVVKDFLGEPHHSSLHGEIHVLALNNDFPESDNITIFHFSVPNGEREWI